MIDYVFFAQVVAVKLWSTTAGVVSNDGNTASNSLFAEARAFTMTFNTSYMSLAQVIAAKLYINESSFPSLGWSYKFFFDSNWEPSI